MIAAHDSFTCYEPKHKIFNLCKWLWKCQYTTNDINKLDAEYMDVRVRYDKKRKKYITCHGFVDLKYEFNSINDIFKFFESHPGRLVIERGNTDIPIKEFIDNFRLTNLSEFIIKKGWKNIYRSGMCNKYKHKTMYHQYWLSNLSFIENIKRIFKYKCTIKSYSLIVNDFIKNERNVITFMDYCKIK